MDTMGQRLRAARAEAGHPSASAGAERVGVKASTYRAHENGQNEFGPGEAEAYGRAFGVRPAWLLTGEPPKAGAGPAPPAPNASFPPVYQEFPGERIPLLGQVAGGPNGRFVLNGQEVARVFVPPPLRGVSGAYAVYVHGTSMEPRYFAGEVVWLHPHAPVRQGDFCVVQIAGDHEGDERGSYIKQFVSRSQSGGLVLRQLNPPPGEEEILRFPEDSVFSVHKIVFSGSV